jgi:hypothetical protein
MDKHSQTGSLLMAVISGGTTLIDNGALDAGVPTGSLILLSTQTASASANISFTTGLDSTYDEYIFKFIDIHPSGTDTEFDILFSSDGGSTYGLTKTTTAFYALHNEADTVTALTYSTGTDLAQSTSPKNLMVNVGDGNDESGAGTLTLFNPSSTTYVKHFIANVNIYDEGAQTVNRYTAGYVNTTSAINAIRFQMSSGNIDDGIIKLYGVK